MFKKDCIGNPQTAVYAYYQDFFDELLYEYFVGYDTEALMEILTEAFPNEFKELEQKINSKREEYLKAINPNKNFYKLSKELAEKYYNSLQ